VWTNPLKRIIPHFYQDYLKIFIIPADKTLPLLQYDTCIGAFIFSLETKNFAILKKRFPTMSAPSIGKPSFSFPKKEIAIFAFSFLLSFLAFVAVSKMGSMSIKVPTLSIFPAKPTATPTPQPPTPTPTVVAVERSEIKVKILNGSGVRGKATEVRDILKEAGYGEILTGNADNFDYTTTEIQVKKDMDKLAETMKEDLKDYVEKPDMTILDEDEASDIVLIFGADFK
jgi:hypothetical protein